jgi:hypothetical protein
MRLVSCRKLRQRRHSHHISAFYGNVQNAQSAGKSKKLLLEQVKKGNLIYGRQKSKRRNCLKEGIFQKRCKGCFADFGRGSINEYTCTMQNAGKGSDEL